MPKEKIKVLTRTKKVGKYRLTKIVSMVYEKTVDGWWVSVIDGKGCATGWGPTKKTAKDDFIKEFEIALRTFSDIVVGYPHF